MASLALEIGLTHEEADRIESAGQVHDVGKIAVDPAILAKSDQLTAEEFAEMKRRPALDVGVIARFAVYRDGASLIRHHHEASDGARYPEGLSGKAIPLGARILAVAGAYDALTSSRPYRTSMDPARARQALTDGAALTYVLDRAAAQESSLDAIMSAQPAA